MAERCPDCDSEMHIIGTEKAKDTTLVWYAVWHCDECNKDHNTHDLFLGSKTAKLLRRK